MKVKNLLFITIFLAAASLGLALPPKIIPLPGLSPKNPPPKASPPKSLPSNVTISPEVDQVLATVPESVIGGISKQCQTALLGLITSPEFLSCVPLKALLPLVPLVADPSILANFIKDPAKNYSPVEGPLIQFATLFCPAPRCSDKGVAGAIKIIEDGCKDDLANKNPFASAIFGAAVFYSPIKDITCFKDGKKFCWDESILTAISLPPSPFVITGDKFIDAVAVADPSAVCTNCNKEIINTFFNFIKNNDLALQILAGVGVNDKALTLAKTGVAVKCGAKFEDGKVPK
jgi:hypothetical protein